jgi:CBS domain-containing protein
MKIFATLLLFTLASAASAAFSSNQHRVFVSTPSSIWPRKTVGECMKPKSSIPTLSPTTTVDEAISLFLTFGVHSAPIVDENLMLLGMVSQFDFMGKEAFEGSLIPLGDHTSQEKLHLYMDAAKKICGTTVEDVMSTKVLTVKPSTGMREVRKRTLFFVV